MAGTLQKYFMVGVLKKLIFKYLNWLFMLAMISISVTCE